MSFPLLLAMSQVTLLVQVLTVMFTTCPRQQPSSAAPSFREAQAVNLALLFSVPPMLFFLLCGHLSLSPLPLFRIWGMVGFPCFQGIQTLNYSITR